MSIESKPLTPLAAFKCKILDTSGICVQALIFYLLNIMLSDVNKYLLSDVNRTLGLE